jgi:uncharacterized damage-inducible protein DinB
MDLQDLRTLVDYHYWARDRLLDAVERLTPEQFSKDLGNSFSSIRDTLAHLYGADWLWCSRWEGGMPQDLPDVRTFPDKLSDIRTMWKTQEQKVRAVLDRLGEAGINRPIEYQALDGSKQAQVFWCQLQHLVNHGSYHRGQVTTMLRQLEVTPAKSMDLIAFYRERAAVG